MPKGRFLCVSAPKSLEFGDEGDAHACTGNERIEGYLQVADWSKVHRVDMQGSGVAVEGSGAAVSTADGVTTVLCGQLENTSYLVTKFAPEGGLKGRSNFPGAAGEAGSGALGIASLYAPEAEVICYMYRQLGPALLPKLRGHYALVCYDSSNMRVLAARDPTGTVPLHAGRLDDGTLVISSCQVPFIPGGDNLPEIPAAHFIFGRRADPQRFARTTVEIRAKGAEAAEAAKRALEGVRSVVQNAEARSVKAGGGTPPREGGEGQTLLRAAAPVFVPSVMRRMSDKSGSATPAARGGNRKESGSKRRSTHDGTPASSAAAAASAALAHAQRGGSGDPPPAPGRASAAPTWRRASEPEDGIPAPGPEARERLLAEATARKAAGGHGGGNGRGSRRGSKGEQAGHAKGGGSPAKQPRASPPSLKASSHGRAHGHAAAAPAPMEEDEADYNHFSALTMSLATVVEVGDGEEGAGHPPTPKDASAKGSLRVLAGGGSLPPALLEALGSSSGLHMDTIRMVQSLASSSPCGVVVTDASRADHPIMFCNGVFEYQTGYSSDEIIGRNCRFLQSPPSTRLEHTPTTAQMRKAVASNTHSQFRVLNYTKQGAPMWNDLAICPLRDAGGAVTHHIGIQNFTPAPEQDLRHLRHIASCSNLASFAAMAC